MVTPKKKRLLTTYGANSPEFTWDGQKHDGKPTVPYPPDGEGWEFLSAVCDEGYVIWYWKRTIEA